MSIVEKEAPQTNHCAGVVMKQTTISTRNRTSPTPDRLPVSQSAASTVNALTPPTNGIPSAIAPKSEPNVLFTR